MDFVCGNGSDQRGRAVTRGKGQWPEGKGTVTKWEGGSDQRGRGQWPEGRGSDQRGRGSDQRGRSSDQSFFPSVRNRLRQKIPTFPKFTTGIGKLRTNLHRFGLTDDPMCPCEEEAQSTGHSIFQCKKLRNQRNEMIKHIKTFVAAGRRQMKHLSIIIYKVL